MIIQNKKEERFCPLCQEKIEIDDLIYLLGSLLICEKCYKKLVPISSL
jgi:hypothetical protein